MKRRRAAPRRARRLAPAWRKPHAGWRRPVPWLVGLGLLILAGPGLMQACRPSGPRAGIRPALPAELKAPRLVVRKADHVLRVYDGERLVQSYPAAVGGGKGDKVREGDRCTPEGEFYVCMKNPDSLYVLSLGLSYPNQEDAARGLRDGLITPQQHDEIVSAVENRRQPPWYTPLGGEIMIHGCRNGRTTTAGCVALEDDEIRQLYPLIPVGTPVTILP